MNNQDDGKYFKLSEGFDLGMNNVSHEQGEEQHENEDNSATDYEELDELRSMPSEWRGCTIWE